MGKTEIKHETLVSVSVLVAGATGVIGREFVKIAAADPAVQEIVALTRRPVSGTEARVQWLEYADPAERTQIPRTDVLLCALGTTMKRAGSKEAFQAVDADLVVLLAEKAKAAGIGRMIVVSGVGASEASGVFYLQCKGRMERLVKEGGPAEVCFLRPSLLLGERNESRPGEDIAKKVLPWIPWKTIGLEAYSPVQSVTVARAALRLALADELPEVVSSGKIIEIGGNHISI